MPDNSQAIADLTQAINSGAMSTSVDGQSVTFQSLSEMKKLRQELINGDTSGAYDGQKRQRPVNGQIDLGGAW